MRKIVLIKGDGIGPEVCDAAVGVIGATGVEIEWMNGQGARPMWTTAESFLTVSRPCPKS